MTNMKSKILPILALATVLFLFASPAVVAQTNKSTPLTAPAGVTPGTVRGTAMAGSPNKGGSGEVFVTNLEDGAVDVLNTAGKLVTEIEDGGCSGYGATFIPTTGLVWVFDYSCSTVYVISPATNAVVTSFSCAYCIFGTYVASNKMVYASQFAEGEVIPINAKTYAEGSEISVCSYYPEYITTASDGMVYTPAREGCYSIINPKTNGVTNVDLGTYPNGVACATTGKTAMCWITDEDNGNVYVVSGSKLIATISGCSDCYWGATYNPANKAAYMTGTEADVYPIVGKKLGTAITMEYGSDAACVGLSKEVVVPEILSESPGYAGGISTKNKVVWNTQLGSESDYPEGCGTS